MKNTKTGTTRDFTQEEQDVLDTLIVADFVYEAVISQLNIDKSDELYVNLMVGVLKRQTRDHLISQFGTI